MAYIASDSSRRLFLAACAVALQCLLAPFSTPASAGPVEQGALLPPYSLVYDSARDPASDFDLALRAAKEADRRVLIMVGGDWCVWCFLLDRHLGLEQEASEAIYGGFVVLRVYYGDDNTNQSFLSRFPDFELFPHFFIVESDGRVVASIDADVLIADARYDTGLIKAFAKRWH